MTRSLTRRWRRVLAGLLVAGPLLASGALTGVPAARAAAEEVSVNEVVTTGGVEDSIELYNRGTDAVDLSGWILRDDGDDSAFEIPSGTTLAPGGYQAFDVHEAFGLGSEDEARLYRPDGKTLVDGVSWGEHSDPSWSRCPDGTGELVKAAAVTLGGANSCDDTAPKPWPGSEEVTTADAADVFGEDLSGLYQEGEVLWGAQNSGKLWRLVPDGSDGWKPDSSGGWSSGKSLRFPGGSGAPDSEGVTLTDAGADGGVFVASERDGDDPDTSRPSVLRYEPGADGSSLTATREWDLTSDLPESDPNLGLEGITWVPDGHLTDAGLKDASTGEAYDPGRYGAHSGGVFLVAAESTGMVYGYVLEDSGDFTRVTSFGSGLPGVMEVQWEPQAKRLWAVCDDTCAGQHRTLEVDDSGTFAVTAAYERPGGMPNLNNEGFALSGAEACVNGSKPVYWSDDSNDDGHALRRGGVDC